MKTTILFAAFISAALSSCIESDLPSNWDRKRNETMEGGYVPGRSGGPAGAPSGDGETGKPDTSVYLSAVIVPDGYDWQRDSACGNVSGRITLMENFKAVHSFPTGASECVSTDPDTHHIIMGDLYTEYSTAGETVIKRNGTELFRYAGRESLRGILPEGEDVYTVGTDKDDGHMTYRKNGVPVLSKPDCTVFGGYGNGISCGRTGALYKDEGHIYFSYGSAIGSEKAYYLVKDGENIQLSENEAKEIYDIRISNGEVFKIGLNRTAYLTIFSPSGNRIYRQGQNIEFHNVRLRETGSGMSASGEMNRISSSSGSTFLWRENGSFTTFPDEGTFILDDTGGFAILQSGSDALTLFSARYNPVIIKGTYHIFSPDCFCYRDSCAFLALTPRASGARPSVWIDGQAHKLDFNGYLSCIDAEITVR